MSKPDKIELRACGIDETQAADIRERLRTFADDWNRPEADVYDEELSVISEVVSNS
ncbi:MAG TPA: hypothetical protein VK475_03185 [Pyrinomonadaceae bacterium]|nr:hypothetical protein [Pyrinomonadaceae bacterium]